MAIHQEGTPAPPPPKRRTLEEGIIFSVDTEKVKIKNDKGVLTVDIKEEDPSVYIKDGALRVNLDASRS